MSSPLRTAHFDGDAEQLLALLQIDPQQLAATTYTPTRFKLRVPMSFVARMQTGNPRDPLLLQVLPLAVEQQPQPLFSDDPVDDLQHQVTPGLIHKYQGRALLLTTPACDIHCRYCFRNSFPYPKLAQQDWQAIFSYLQANTSISEIILSGGDPLTLSLRRLRELFTELEKIPHLNTLRIHSRQPIAHPESITPEVIQTWQQTRFKKVLVVHCNHGNEINQAVTDLIQQFRQAQVLVLNQAVLLRGINNDVETLCQLSQRLFAADILPYYVNLLDRASGTAHFEVTETQALELMQQLSLQLPGYLLPRLVRDIADVGAKSRIY